VSDKSSALKNISGELAKQGKIEEALSCARGIPDVSDQSRTLKDISTELAKQGKVEEAASAMQEALTCAREINSDQIRDNALKVISVELARQGKIEDAEEVGRTIGSRNERQKLWQVIAGIPLRNYDLQLILSFKQEESRFELLKVLASNVNILKVDWSYTEALLRHLVHDSDSIEKLLTKHAIHSLFLTDVSEELILRMNKTLNIQWAINIRNQVN
jgi:tetratricopeptide (TPR) repeat protein